MMSILYYSRREADQFLEATMNTPLKVALLGYGQIYKIISSQNPNNKQYEAVMGNFLTCIFLDFVNMISSSLGW